ncbi:RHS repeat domain-containing protein [Elizabethkingia meningoseptica]|uniref:RHS repeat domain-containing protein n=1 Tax=Elizabethkingia meningoseptica TaxID=238 RepID=UPI003891DFD9
MHKDYLGSILAISDEQGNLVQETHFDAWSRLAAGGIGLLGRSYTSHEHFEDIGIIHMNGRLYDPLLRRFLNADENIQDPYNTQNYNKYGYVINNPLMYNDPNGQFLQVLFAIIQIISLVIAAVQLVSMIVQLATGNITFGQFLKFFLVQAVSALISYGVGELFKPGGFAIKVLGKATAKLAKPVVHALSQGVLSVMRGENVMNGFGTALLASVAAGYGLKLGGSEQWSRVLGATVSGAIGGGVGSVLTGGNFWQGAATGAIIGFFNESMHDSKLSDPPTDFNGDVWFDKNGDSYIKKGEFLYDHYGANGELIGSYISEVEVGKTYRDFRDMASGIQNAGDALTVLGYALTLSIVGSEVGVPLVMVGSLISEIGSGIEISAHLINGKWGKAGESFAWMAAGRVIPERAVRLLDPGVSTIAKNIYEYSMSTKVILIQRAVNQ